MSDVDDGAVERFTNSVDPIVSRNSRGEIIYPTDPDEIEKALRLERAYAQFFRNGDDSLLVEEGMFPAPEASEEQPTPEQRKSERMRTRRRSSSRGEKR